MKEITLEDFRKFIKVVFLAMPIPVPQTSIPSKIDFAIVSYILFSKGSKIRQDIISSD